jgi:DNA-binding GntR family transcriptional regulator
MTEIKIEEIEQHFDDILALTGSDSFVNWETFTKSSTDFIRSLEELAKNIAILREIQQKKFITTMKRLKSADIPDLIKTVRSKKLPR